MNSVRLGGEIVSDIRPSTNQKKKCFEVSFLLAAPFHHPLKEASPDDLPSFMRTFVFDKEADWVFQNLYQGSHIEIRKGFIQTWYVEREKRTYYRIVGYEIDRIGCFQVPPFNEENHGWFSGHLRKQFFSGEYKGVKEIGVSIAATPDMRFFGTSYMSYLTVWLYGEAAEKTEKSHRGRSFHMLEGQLEAFKNQKNGSYGLCIHSDKIEF